MTKIRVLFEDITKQRVGAIVNAANTSLLGGGGVDGAIHRAAGKELLEACRALNGCKTGKAKITPGFQLPAKFVIHTVGPIWYGGNHNEPQELESCYRNSMKLAWQNGVKRIAFPNISTGVYGYPKELAAEIAISTVKEMLNDISNTVEEVIFCILDRKNLEIYQSLLST